MYQHARALGEGLPDTCTDSKLPAGDWESLAHPQQRFPWLVKAAPWEDTLYYTVSYNDYMIIWSIP